MSSSPIKLCNSTYSSDFEDVHTSPEPEMCDCQNQLGHFDWSGNPHENLPELCRRTLGIGADPDYEWKQGKVPNCMYKLMLKSVVVILRRASRSQPKDLNARVEGPILIEAAEADTAADKGDAGDLTRMKGRKRRISNEDTWTSKKSKVSLTM
jgi:hypothetical protein